MDMEVCRNGCDDRNARDDTNDCDRNGHGGIELVVMAEMVEIAEING